MTIVDIQRPAADQPAGPTPDPRAGRHRNASRVVPLLVWLSVLTGVTAGVLAAVRLLPLAGALTAVSAACLGVVAVVEAVTGHSGPLTLRRVGTRTPEGDVS